MEVLGFLYGAVLNLFSYGTLALIIYLIVKGVKSHKKSKEEEATRRYAAQKAAREAHFKKIDRDDDQFLIKDAKLIEYRGTDDRIVIPKGVESLYNHDFSIRVKHKLADGPSEVCIPRSVRFIGCHALPYFEEIYYEGSEYEWKQIYIADENFETGWRPDWCRNNTPYEHYRVTEVPIIYNCGYLWNEKNSSTTTPNKTTSTTTPDKTTSTTTPTKSTSTTTPNKTTSTTTPDKTTSTTTPAKTTSTTTPNKTTSTTTPTKTSSDTTPTKTTSTTTPNKTTSTVTPSKSDPTRDFVIQGHVLERYTGTAELAIIPATVRQISPTAFQNCNHFFEVVLPEGFLVVEHDTFKNNEKLRGITLPSSLKVIGNRAFSGCINLATINFPPRLKSIGERAFYKTALTSVSLSGMLEEIGRRAFEDCKSLKSVELGNSIKFISYQMFAGCTNLASVNLPNSLRRIEYGAFSDCKSLATVTLPSSVYDVNERAFDPHTTVKK